MTHRSVSDFLGANFLFDGRHDEQHLLVRSRLTGNPGVSLGWSPSEIVPVGQSVSTTIDMDTHTLERPNQVDIAIRNNGLLNIRYLVEYLQQSIEPDYVTNIRIEQLIKFLNTLFRQDPASRFFTRPKSNAFFHRTRETTLRLKSTGGVLEALRGFSQTVQIRFGHIGLCVDTATAAFYTPELSLIELSHALVGIPPTENLQEFFETNRPRFFQACQRVEGLFIIAKHLTAQPKEKKLKVVRLSEENAEGTTFVEKDNQSGTERSTTVSA